jgi:hypothetical protein
LDRIRYPLLEDGQFPADLRFRTTDYYVYGYGTEANRLQVGAPDKPQPFANASDIGIQIHHSALNNLGDGTLAGRRVTQPEFEKQIIDLMGRLPDRLKRGPDDEPWALVFASERPLRIMFGDNVVTIALNVVRVEGTAESDNPWIIKAIYTIEPAPNGFKLVRQGELDVSPPGYKEGDQLSAAIVGEARNVRRQFSKNLFEPEFVHDGLELTGDWEKAGKLPVSEYLSAAGWVNLAWRLNKR